MAQSSWALRSSPRTASGSQGLIRKKSAQFEGSVVSTTSRGIAASVCSVSHTRMASQSSSRWARCGFDKLSMSGARKAHNFGDGGRIRASIGRPPVGTKYTVLRQHPQETPGAGVSDEAARQVRFGYLVIKCEKGR